MTRRMKRTMTKRKMMTKDRNSEFARLCRELPGENDQHSSSVDKTRPFRIHS
jgi:hypothetical protein